MNTTTENITLRNMVLHNPDISLEDVRVKCKELKFGGKPADIGQRLSSARFNTKQKYGLKNLKEIPFTDDGKLDVGGLVRLLRKKSPDISVLQIKTYLASDGINVNDQFINDALVGRPTNTNGKPHLPLTPQEEPLVPTEAVVGDNGTAPPTPKPDLTEHPPTPPKVKAKTPPHPKKGQINKAHMEELDNKVATTYLSMEDEIDGLLAKAREVSDTPLVEALKAARRHVIIRSDKLIKAK